MIIKKLNKLFELLVFGTKLFKSLELFDATLFKSLTQS